MGDLTVGKHAKMRTLASREVEVFKVLDEVITVDDDLIDLARQRGVDACALERVLEHPKQLLEVAASTRGSTLLKEAFF